MTLPFAARTVFHTDRGEIMPTPAPILVFDVNETLLDLESLAPIFERLFGTPQALRDWFNALILNSQTLTLAGQYRPFNDLAAATLRMQGVLSGHTVTDADISALMNALSSMPVASDVPPALERLQSAGFRLMTLTNSPPSPHPTPLERAGLADCFEHHFSVDAVRRFKPHPACYRQVVDTLGVEPEDLCLIACHAWDTLGARAIGCQSAWFRRPGNALIGLTEIPDADVIADDLPELVTRLCTARAG